MEFNIVAARPEDKKRILEILSVYNMGDFGHSEREAMPNIDNFLVAKKGAQIVGCAAYLLNDQSKLTINERQAETGSLAVLPEYRGKGLGYQLQTARMQKLVGMGIETLFTETDTPENINWYLRKFGYRKLHTRKKTASFGDPQAETFSLLETNLKRWHQKHWLKKKISCARDVHVDWYNEKFGELSEIVPDTSRKLIINAAITGMVPRRKDSPHVPLSPEEIITDVERCYAAGATIVHLHAREADGAPTYKASAYQEFVPEIRRRCKGIIINLTTSGRDFNKIECRSDVLTLKGEAKPDMASLTVGSNNFPKQASVNSPQMIQQLAKIMLQNGIKPELEIFEVGMINYAAYLHRKGFLKPPFYFNLLLGSLGAIPARITDLNHMISTLPENSTWGATGLGRFQLPINLAAVIKGGHVRIGLEDNLYYDNQKTMFATNAQLIERVTYFSKSIGREIASPEETRRMIGL